MFTEENDEHQEVLLHSSGLMPGTRMHTNHKSKQPKKKVKKGFIAWQGFKKHQRDFLGASSEEDSDDQNKKNPMNHLETEESESAKKKKFKPVYGSATESFIYLNNNKRV